MIDKNNSEIDLTEIANKSHELERENFRATIKKDKFWAKIGLLIGLLFVILGFISSFFQLGGHVESAHEKEMLSKWDANFQAFGWTRFWCIFVMMLFWGFMFTDLAWRLKKSSLFWEENPLIPFLYGCLWLVVLCFTAFMVAWIVAISGIETG